MKELVISALRTLLQIAGTALAANPSIAHILPAADWSQISDLVVAIVSGGITLGATVWMLVDKITPIYQAWKAGRAAELAAPK